MSTRRPRATGDLLRKGSPVFYGNAYGSVVALTPKYADVRWSLTDMIVRVPRDLLRLLPAGTVLPSLLPEYRTEDES